MIAFAKEQERFRAQMKDAIGKSPMDVMSTAPLKAFEDQARRNVEMFQNALRMFTPFPAGGATAPEPEARDEKPADDLKELRDQIAAMQRRIDDMGRR